MKKMFSVLYGAVCYCAFLGTILYAIGFAGNLFVPKTIDGEPQVELLDAILTNISLLLLFGLQHSIMARPAFKSWWTTIIPAHLERSTYVLLSSVCLALMMWHWEPVGGIIWSVKSEAAKNVLMVVYLFGWMVAFASTFLINHFDLFGLRQVWLYATGKPYTHLPFGTPLLYKVVRHPLYFGFLIAFWATPVMTVTHLLFAILTTCYMLIAIPLEEKDLVEGFGETYQAYKKWVPMIVPFTKRKVTK
jgi:methanethiol S-methyltransferase